MKRTKYKVISLLLAIAIIVYACSKSFLDITPPGTLNPEVVANKAGVEGLLIGAYSLLDGIGGGVGSTQNWEAAASNWIYGSIGGGDAHKGSDPGDQNLITPIETWQVNPANDYLNVVWSPRFDGVQRCNETIRIMRQATDMAPEDTIEVTAEARFLRGHYYFELKKMFGNVPWIDETVSYTAGNFLIPNNTDIFPNIEADFSYAYQNLPETQADLGRANKWAAACYLAKTYLFEKKFSDARTLLTTIVASGKTAGDVKYALVPHFYDLFNAETDINSESVFSVQNSVNDGAGGENADKGDILNYPYGGPFNTCCGFFQPSYSLVNAYKVDANGLPFLDDSYNNTNLKNDEGIASSAPYTPDNTTPVDPRLDWTVGRRGIPYLDWGICPGADWIRNQASAGPYIGKKISFRRSQVGSLTDNSGWISNYTAINTPLIRYADVLLWAAEAEIEGGGSPEQARDYVNQVRGRAADPAGFVQSSPANYKIGLYPAGSFDNADYARKAIYFERKLELAMEGHRFFDISRWEIADHELNAVIYPREIASGYALDVGAHWTAGKNEYLPIPQTQIDRSSSGGQSVLAQNPGY